MKHSQEEIECINLMRYLENRYPEIHCNIFHVPNEGKRTIQRLQRLKKLGLRPGVADYIMLVPRCGFNALALEYKTKLPRGRLSDTQKTWLNWVKLMGNAAVVVYGFDEALAAILAYWHNDKKGLMQYEI